MGHYHYLVNLDKRQVIHPHQIGNGLKLHEEVGWPYSTATALVMLLAASSKKGGRSGGDFRAEHQVVGSWAGDRIAFIGDYAESGDIPSAGDATCLYQLARAALDGPEVLPQELKEPFKISGWKNISLEVREMMSAEFGIVYRGEIISCGAAF